jgi:hypothetical protein
LGFYGFFKLTVIQYTGVRWLMRKKIVRFIIYSILIFFLVEKNSLTSIGYVEANRNRLIQTVTDFDVFHGMVNLNLFQITDFLKEQDINLQKELIKNCLVTIEYEDHYGTGVVYQVEYETITILTAKHVIDVNKECNITLSSGMTQKAKVLFLSESLDIAFLQIKIQAIDETELKPYLQLYQVGSNNFIDQTMIKAGDQVLQGGAILQGEMEVYTGYIVNPKQYIPEFDMELINNNSYSKPGMSGGPLFLYSGEFIGMIIAGAENSTLCIENNRIAMEYEKLKKFID